MAYWGAGCVDNRSSHPTFGQTGQHNAGKRRAVHYEEEHIVPFLAGEVEEDDEYPLQRPLKRRRQVSAYTARFADESFTSPSYPAPKVDAEYRVSERNPSASPHSVAGAGMERTNSGMSISDDMTDGFALIELLGDMAAAQRVQEHMATFWRRNPDSKHERVLRSIIRPRSVTSAYPLDDHALQSMFIAANELFFNGRLSKRVTWDWSHASSQQYDSSVIGTTALRRASGRGFETLIVLSSPILRARKYSRRLLISTFLHELIHSYMFICCGFTARQCGGHTPGFKTIAGLIDDWAGSASLLHLREMEADLSCFREDCGMDVKQDTHGDETPSPRERIVYDEVERKTPEQLIPPPI
ncbi:hypothetical protein DL546_003014 [Coniochaeta pulveracea]|uniref:SprT-like domain-containing protein n=1 Tax=Coniochaeta pulveracea TaxID=177199 RepID=A0A420YL00_9PEZI|nr:hypothetical protein DL546_003014 [Coniochaeta pulveracea]